MMVEKGGRIMSDETVLLMSIAVSVVYTIILYGVGPLVFAILRKKPVTKRKVKWFSVLYSFSAWLCSNLFWALYAGDSVSSGGAALLWGWIFYKLLKRHLSKTNRLTEAIPAIPASRCQTQESEMGKFVVDSETGEVTREEPIKPKQSNTISVGEHVGGTGSVRLAEPPVVQSVSTQEPDTPKNRVYKTAVISLSAVCAVLAIFVFLLGYSANSTRAEHQQLVESVEALTAENAALQETVSELESQNKKAQEKITSLEAENANLERDLESSRITGTDMFSSLYHIGFIVNGSPYYHLFTCDVYTSADTYWAHNIEYCEYLGYSRCPDCW